MSPVTHSENRHTIVYDADLIPEPDLRLFDPQYWESKQAVTGRAKGRGSVLFLQTPFGPAALRSYLRGGVPARFSKDRYFFTGLERSRPFREFRLLVEMNMLELPVPVPIAAFIERKGFFYQGSILMQKIEGARPLSDYLGTEREDSAIWAATGRCIRRFHKAGVNHSDLNANNLLMDGNGENIYLIDFDRCTINTGSVISGQRNLSRLKRSLTGLWPANAQISLAACWNKLMEGYND